MQWNRFTEFSANHLALAPCLVEQLQPVSGKLTMKDIVERQLEYIAVRPWGSLDLDQTGSHQLTDVGEVNVTYTVYAHIGGNETHCSRARASYGKNGESIRQLIKSLDDWHQVFWARQEDRPIMFDAVTRTSNLVSYGWARSPASKKTLSFYLFPEGFKV